MYAYQAGTGWSYLPGQFGKSVIAKNGQFIVTPFQSEAASSPPGSYSSVPALSGVYGPIRIKVVSTNATSRIDINNNATSTTPSPTNNVSNTANVMTFDGGSFDTNTTYSPKGSGSSTTEPSTTSLSNVNLWTHNGKFYWIVSGQVINNVVTGGQYVYEWDPSTWGGGQYGTSATAGSSLSPILNLLNAVFLGQTSSQYVGRFSTVRLIGPASGSSATTLWSPGNPVPQIVFNDVDNEFYLRDGTHIHRVNPRTGYTPNLLSTLALPSNRTTQGQMMAFDPNTDALYFAGSNGYINAYLPRAGTTLKLTQAPLNDSNLPDDGNMFYSSLTQQLFYLDAPSNGGTPTMYIYTPASYVMGTTDNVANSMFH